MENLFNPISFKKRMEAKISEAWDAVINLESSGMSGDSEGADYYQDLLKYQLEELVTGISFILELLGLQSLLAEFKQEIKIYRDENKGKLHILTSDNFGDLTCPAIGIINKYLKAIYLTVDISDDKESIEKQRSNLERILISTPKIIYDRDIKPENEADVRKAVYDILIHLFPDTVREVPITKVSKTYKPDIGIKSIKTAVEYKFADSKEEVKKCIGGIYEDIKGYAGSEDWKFFYAVIYMTEAFFTQAQINAEFEISKVDNNWKPILVIGRGERKKPGKS